MFSAMKGDVPSWGGVERVAGDSGSFAKQNVSFASFSRVGHFPKDYSVVRNDKKIRKRKEGGREEEREKGREGR